MTKNKKHSDSSNLTNLGSSELNIAQLPSSEKELGSFPARLKKVIDKRSVRSFASDCGMSDTVIRQYLSGKSEPTRPAIIAIARVSGCSIEWLMTGEGEMRRGTVEYPLAETIKNADIISSDKHVPVPLVTTGKTPPGVSGSHPADPERPLGWFYEWLEDELRGKSVTEIMRFAVKIKAELDKEG